MPDKRANPFYQAQAILSRRDHTESEMRAKLRRKNFTAKQIEDVISALRRASLIDDEQFARRYAESTLRSRAVGPRWLSAKLRQKGIAAGTVEQVINDTYPPDAEIKIAKKAARKWRARQKDKTGDKAKLMRFLTSRGFSAGIINDVIQGNYSLT